MGGQEGMSNRCAELTAYELRHLLAHLVELEWKDQLCDVLTDIQFLQAKIGADNSSSYSFVAAPGNSVYDLLHDFLSVIDAFHAAQPQLEEVKALYRAIDERSHVLKKDRSLLLQHTHNRLVWEWDETTELGRRLREAAREYTKTW